MTEIQQQARDTRARQEQADGFTAATDQAPDGPTDLPKMQWKAVLKRTVGEFGRDGGTDLAAALTYYSMMSLAPMLLAIISLLSFFGQGDAADETINELGSELGLEESTIDTATGYLDSLSQTGGTGLFLVIGLIGSLWSASNYVNAFSRMMNQVYEVQEGRPVWKLRPWLLGLTALMLLLIVLIIVSVSLSGALSEALFGVLGLSGTANTIWNYAKWPVILFILIGMIALLYWGTPNVRQPSFRWLSPGAVLALVMAILAAGGFGFYAANFGSYDATYGALGAVIILLLVVWLINTALVFGAELDAELERGRELAAGMPAEESILLPPRDVKGTEKKLEKAAEQVREARELRMGAERHLREQGHEVGLPGRDRPLT